MLYLTYKPFQLKKKTHCHILSRIIRSGTKKSPKWKYLVKEKDGFICKSCGKKNCLEVHHKKPFAQIFREFLAVYAQFSYIKDKGTLLKLAEEYQPFWETNNGKTLCKDCHKIIEDYKKEILLPKQFKKEMLI